MNILGGCWHKINPLQNRHKIGLKDWILILAGLNFNDGWVGSTTPHIMNKTNMKMCLGMLTKPLRLKKKTKRLCSWHSKAPSACSLRPSNNHFLHRRVVTCWQIILLEPVSTAISPHCYSQVVHVFFVITCLPPKAFIQGSVQPLVSSKSKISHTLTHTHRHTELNIKQPFNSNYLMWDIIIIRLSGTGATGLSSSNGSSSISTS